MTAVRIVGALWPSVAVLLGLYGLHSAWAAVLLYHFGIVAFALVLRRRRSSDPTDETIPLSELGRRTLRWMLPVTIMCALSGVAFYLLWDWIVQPGVSLSSWLGERGMSGWSWWLFVPYFGLLHPVLEELHWSRLVAGLPSQVGLFDALFAGYHLLVLASLVRWPWLLLIFVILVCSSVFWRQMYRSRETRFVPLLTHGAADLSIVIAASLLVLAGR